MRRSFNRHGIVAGGVTDIAIADMRIIGAGGVIMGGAIVTGGVITIGITAIGATATLGVSATMVVAITIIAPTIGRSIGHTPVPIIARMRTASAYAGGDRRVRFVKWKRQGFVPGVFS